MLGVSYLMLIKLLLCTLQQKALLFKLNIECLSTVLFTNGYATTGLSIILFGFFSIKKIFNPPNKTMNLVRPLGGKGE